MHDAVTALITSDEIDPVTEHKRLHIPNDCGGFVTFEGIVRNHNQGRDVSHIIYEAYEPLASKELLNILGEALERWPIKHIHVKHRVGQLTVGDVAVVIYVIAHHRKEAFAACQYTIDELKKRVPIWKKEHFTDGSSDWSYCQEHQH